MRERRAIEIDEACQAHLAQGGTVWLVTLTVPHSCTDAFLDVLDRLQDLYRDTFSGRSGRQLRKDLDVVGLIRAWDITYGVRNGWHPHMHVLFFAQGDRFNGQALCAAWEAGFTARGYDYVPTVSADFRQVNVTDGASGYVAKADGGWGAGLELARTDLKRGVGMTPQQLLELASTGEARWVRLWAEYEKGMFRRRVIQWTPGLRKRLGLGEIATDEQAAEGLAPDEVVCVLLVTRTTWNRYRQAGQLARLLQLLEGGQLPDGVYGCTGDPP